VFPIRVHPCVSAANLFFTLQTSLDAWPTVAVGRTPGAFKEDTLAADERR
jgi:hypothetical protein